MNLNGLVFRNLLHFWRTNLAVVSGIACAVAVLAGALLVGRSVRESLRDLVFQRIGATGIVVSADRFFRAELAACSGKAYTLATTDKSKKKAGSRKKKTAS